MYLEKEFVKFLMKQLYKLQFTLHGLVMDPILELGQL